LGTKVLLFFGLHKYFRIFLHISEFFTTFAADFQLAAKNATKMYDESRMASGTTNIESRHPMPGQWTK